MNIPLPERMRPKNLEEYVGQQHILGQDKPLRMAILQGILPSIIFWGPPGVGKTSLANVIAKQLKRNFYSLSAIHAGVKDVREIIEKAKNDHFFGTNKPILFIDEIHRFSKSQQDSLLAAVEKGILTLIGATTENPSFEVIPALLSRCQVYVLNLLTKEDLELVLENAIVRDEFLKKKKIKFEQKDALLRISGGDGRKLLNALEIIVQSESKDELIVTNEMVSAHFLHNQNAYDKNGEQHYDIASALIKSIRGSDPNAAVYWLARMIDGGEDVLFIARRLVISASEDIGMANPTALVIANTCYQSVNAIGYPESRIILSQCVIYLATSPKSNASYLAIDNALEEVKRHGNLPVPLHLRNAPTHLMKDLGYGEDYLYSHNYPSNFTEQEFLPLEISGKIFYNPGGNQREIEIKNQLIKLWKNRYKY